MTVMLTTAASRAQPPRPMPWPTRCHQLELSTWSWTWAVGCWELSHLPLVN